MCEATKAKLLPLDDAREEPDVDQILMDNAFPEVIQHNENGYFNIKDITAWLLFKMAEPKEEQAIDWFWWESCQIFATLGTFAETLRKMGLRETNSYMLVRYLIKGELNVESLIKHFVYCGVRISNANSHL